MTAVRWLWCGLTLLAAASAATAQQGGPAMTIKPGTDALELLRGDALVARYHVKGFPRPIFWPVHAPGGQVLTRDWPMNKTIPQGGSSDHIHQKSLWFCHGDVIPEGIALKEKIKGVEGVDFWSEAPGHGRIVCKVRVTSKSTSGNNPATQDSVAHTKNEWQTASPGKDAAGQPLDGTKILDEIRDIHVYDLGKASLIVLRIKLIASVAPITFGDTKEGALGVRINDVIRAGKLGKGKIENAQGKVGEKECWGRISDWCDYSGPIEGKTVGLTVFADPKNAYPTYWHVRDYGLMAANPFGRKKAAFHDGAADQPLVRLSKREHLELRYGVLLHEGDATTGQVAESYQRFVKLRAKEAQP